MCESAAAANLAVPHLRRQRFLFSCLLRSYSITQGTTRRTINVATMHPSTSSSADKPQGSRNKRGAGASLWQLPALFCAWKSLLLLVAVLSPGPGYDTSTQVLLQQYEALSGSWLELLVSKLTRWDAIYFTNSAARQHLFEQEWAFSPFLSAFIHRISRVFPFSQISSALLRNAAVGIVVSHLSHFLAVVMLFRLTYELIPASQQKKEQIAFTTACLHIVSPAGLFLSAAYGESPFAMLNFAGMLCYVISRRKRSSRNPFTTFCGSLLFLFSGFLFSAATTVRTNGLLSGIIFAWDVILHVLRSATRVQRRAPENSFFFELLELFGLLCGGALVACGYAFPQLKAYWVFCTEGNTRPWCGKLPPSIYSFVQAHYWNVGFLRYWTISNIPLFALATPMLLVMMSTGLIALSHARADELASAVDDARDLKRHDAAGMACKKDEFRILMARFALPQVVLSVLALTSFHVQIINRIASGYPVWYITMACAIHAPELAVKGNCVQLRLLARYSQWLVRASVMYALIQGGLYASFMPPA